MNLYELQVFTQQIFHPETTHPTSPASAILTPPFPPPHPHHHATTPPYKSEMSSDSSSSSSTAASASSTNKNNTDTKKDDTADGKKESVASLLYERLSKRLETLRNQREHLTSKLESLKNQVQKAQLIESYMKEENRTKNDEYCSLTDELKHRDQACKSFHSQIARLDRQVEDLHYEMGVGQRLGTGRATSIGDLLPDAVSLALDEALQAVDEEEQKEFTQLQTSQQRLQVIKGSPNAVDRPRVTILVKNVDPSANNRSKDSLKRTFIATEGLTFQDILEDSLRFWNMLPEELLPEENSTSGASGASSNNDGNNKESLKEHERVETDENKDHGKKNTKFCLADEGGAVRFGKMLVTNDIAAADATKDDLVLSYLLFSLPKLDLPKVKEYSDYLTHGGFDSNEKTMEDGVHGLLNNSDKNDSDDDSEENDDEESHVDLFRYDSVLSNTPLLVKDLVFFLCWLILWIMMSIVRRDIAFDNQVSLLSKHWLAMRKWDGDTQDRWVDFESISTTDEWWSWVQGPVTLTMTKAHGMSKAIDFGGSEQGKEGGNAGGTFMLHGGWRLRQARVPPDCPELLDTTISGKAIKNDPKKKLERYYGTYGRVFCYSQMPYGPLFNGTDDTVVSITHLSEEILSHNQSIFSTTTTQHTITKMTETPEVSTIALRYASFDPFKNNIKPPIADPDTIAWLKAFLFYPAPTTLQSIENQYMGPYKDYRNPDYFDTSSKNGQFSDYGGSGYVLELPANLSSASVAYRLQKLKENNWIDKQTRAVIARANFFNVNTGQWAVVDALTEWDQSGKINTRFRAASMLTDHYYTTYGKLGGLLSVIVFLGALSFLYQQIHYWKVVRNNLHSDQRIETIRWLKRSTCPVTVTWLSSIWTVIELGVLVPCLVARILDIVLLFNSKRNFQVNRILLLLFVHWRSLTQRHLLFFFSDFSCFPVHQTVGH